MSQKEIDLLLELLLKLQNVSKRDYVIREAKSLFNLLTRIRFSASDELPVIKG